MRWIDPCPQSGTYTLGTPWENKELSLSFERKNDHTITVTIESGGKSFDLDVLTL